MYFLLFLALTITGISIAEPTSVSSLTANEISKPGAEAIQIHLKKENRLLVQPGENAVQDAELVGFQKKVVELTRRLANNKDGSHAIRIAIIDSARPFTDLATLSNGENLLSISLGEMRLIRTDDYLAFAIQRALEVGKSEIKDRLDKLKAVKPDREEEHEKRRAIINECSAKAIERNLEAGFNPHAVIDALQEKRKIFGDSYSPNEQSVSSQIDVVEAAIGNEANKGKSIPPDSPQAFKTEITSPLTTQYFDSGVFKARQLKKMGEALAKAVKSESPTYSEGKEAYQMILHFPESINGSNMSEPFEKAFNREWEEVERWSSKVIGPVEELDWKGRLYSEIDHAYESARAEVLPNDFRPKSRGQLDALLRLDRRSYDQVGTSVLNEAQTIASNARLDLSRLQDELQRGFVYDRDYNEVRLEGETLVRHKDRIELQKKEVIEAEKKLKEVYTAYLPGTEEFLDRPHDPNIPSTYEIQNPILKQAEEGRRERKSHFELISRRNHVGPLSTRNHKRELETVKNNLDLIKSPSQPFTYFPENVSTLRQFEEDRFSGASMAGHPEFDGLAPQLFKAFVQSVKEDLKKNLLGKEERKRRLRDILWFGKDSDESMQVLFNRYHELNPEGAKADLRELLRTLYNDARSIDEHQSVVRMITKLEPPRRGDFQAPLLQHHWWGGLTLSPEFAKEVFDSDLSRIYQKTLTHSIAKDVAAATELDTLRDQVHDYIRQLERFKSAGIIKDADMASPEFKQGYSELDSNLVSKVRTLLSNERKNPLSQSHARSLAYALNPGLLSIAPKNAPYVPKAETLISHLKEAVADKALTKALSGSISPIGFRMLSSPEGPTDKSNQEIFQLNPIMGFHRDTYKLTPGISQGQRMKELVQYGKWIERNHPKEGFFAARALAPANVSSESYLAPELEASVEEVEAFQNETQDFLRRRFELAEKDAKETWPLASPRAQLDKATRKLWTELLPWGTTTWKTGDTLKAIIAKHSGGDPQKKMEFFLGYTDAMLPIMRHYYKQSEAEKRARNKDAPAGIPPDDSPVTLHMGERFDRDWFNDVMADTPEAKEQVRDPQVLLEAFARYNDLGETILWKPDQEPEATPSLDLFWEHILERFGLNFEGKWEDLSGGEKKKIRENFLKLPEEVQRQMVDPQMIHRIHYQENKANLAFIQLDHLHDLESTGANLKRMVVSGATHALPGAGGNIRLPNLTETRIEIGAIKASLDRMFPEKSNAKAKVTNYVEDVLMTNRPETELLDEGKMKDWTESSSIGSFDLVNRLSGWMNGNFDRFELLQYILGVREDVPQFLAKTKTMDPWVMRYVRAGIRHFNNSDLITRGRVLASLLDETNGLLAEKEYRDKVFEMVLGESGENKFIRAYAEAKREVLETKSRALLRVRLIQALASFPDSPNKHASLVTYLQNQGPYGRKAAQSLTSTGLITGNEREEMKNFYDRGVKPERIDDIDYMEKAFGPHKGLIEHFGPPIGSGSINGTQLLFVKIPDGSTTRVVDATTGLIHTVAEPNAGKTVPISFSRLQNGIKESATAVSEEERATADILKRSSDPEIRSVGEGIYLVDEMVMQSIGEGGVELDKTADRNERWRDAVVSYENRKPNPHSKLVTVVARPVDAVQKLLGSEYQKPVSIWQFIPNERFVKMEEGEKKTALAKHARTTESRASFNGIVDEDGHPGNLLWTFEKPEVYDFAKKEWTHLDVPGALVRIDISQTTNFSTAPKGSPLEVEMASSRANVRPVLDVFGAILQPTPWGLGRGAQMATIAKNFEKAFIVKNAPSGGLNDLQKVLGKVAQHPNWPTLQKPVDRLYFIREQVESTYKKSNPDVRVRLSPQMESVLSSVARSNAFAASISPLDDLKILKEDLVGKNLWWYAPAKAVESLMATKSVPSASETPKTFFRKTCDDLVNGLLK